MPPEPKNESDKSLEEIRREVIESRNLVIKTDNLLKNLHAELKMVGKRQEDFQKRQWVSSGVAYLVFAALCLTGAMLISSARTSSVGADKERLEKQLAELNTQLDKQKAEGTAQAQAQRAANEVYQQMTTLPGEQRVKGIDSLVKLDTSRLSLLEKAALSDRAEALRKEVGQAAFERGKSAFRKNDYPTAVTELDRFLAMNPAAGEALDASFFLGAALSQLKKHEQAIPHLARFVKEDKKSKTRDYGMLLLAQAYEQTQQYERAAEVAREALATYPASEFAAALRGRLAAAKRGLNGGAEPASPSPAAPAKPPAPLAPTPAPLP